MPKEQEEFPSTGKVTLAGKEYTWQSPTLADLEHFETRPDLGPISDPKLVNSVKGRVELISMCLIKHHPELLPGIIRHWPAVVYRESWELILKALPLWGEEAEKAPSPDSSSAQQPDSGDGPQASPDASE